MTKCPECGEKLTRGERLIENALYGGEVCVACNDAINEENEEQARHEEEFQESLKAEFDEYS